MSTCNCDKTVSIGASEYIFGDSLLSDAGVTEAQLSPLLGGFDPRPQACEQAVNIVRAQGLDPCDPESGLQDEYSNAINQILQVSSTTPIVAANNPLGNAGATAQRAVDVTAGTSSPSTQIIPTPPKPQSNSMFLIGAVVLLAIGFLLVFR